MKDDIKIDREIDITGEVCPYTFVKTKLALETLSPGEVLKVILDHQPASENVPRSLQGEGNEIIDVSKVNDTDWQIIARKRAE
ncbi:MAG: sulfurtransferase TusA family protein [bacterium]|nr:sulfurtransferase TusA family protein [bacterium]